MVLTAQDWCKFARPEWLTLCYVFKFPEEGYTCKWLSEVETLFQSSPLSFYSPNRKNSKLWLFSISERQTPPGRTQSHGGFSHGGSSLHTFQAARKTSAVKALLKPWSLSASGFLSCIFSYKAKNALAVKAINNGDNYAAGFGVKLTV